MEEELVEKVDYQRMIEAGWEHYDTQMDYCSICGEYKLCHKLRKQFSKGVLLVSICEDCFIDDTNRFIPLEELE